MIVWPQGRWLCQIFSETTSKNLLKQITELLYCVFDHDFKLCSNIWLKLAAKCWDLALPNTNSNVYFVQWLENWKWSGQRWTWITLHSREARSELAPNCDNTTWHACIIYYRISREASKGRKRSIIFKKEKRVGFGRGLKCTSKKLR